jgi:hypothetical protein
MEIAIIANIANDVRIVFISGSFLLDASLDYQGKGSPNLSKNVMDGLPIAEFVENLVPMCH